MKPTKAFLKEVLELLLDLLEMLLDVLDLSWTCPEGTRMVRMAAIFWANYKDFAMLGL